MKISRSRLYNPAVGTNTKLKKGPGMDAVTLIKQQAANARREFQGVMQDVDQTMAHWAPPGVANPIEDLFLHTVLGQDRQISRLTGQPVVLEQWAEKLNLTADWRHTPEASRSIDTTLEGLKQYADAVYVAVDAYLANLTDAELERMAEGFRGPVQVASQISTNLVSHIYEHTGEISAIKGLQGAKGYATGA
jgi:hypothetical protein